MGAAHKLDVALRSVGALPSNDEAWRERADRLQASLERTDANIAKMKASNTFWNEFVQKWEAASLSDCMAMSREAFPQIEQEQAQ